jgi:hypothetical protein
MQRIVFRFMVVMGIITAVIVGAYPHPRFGRVVERFTLLAVLVVIIMAQVNTRQQWKLRQVEQDQQDVEVPLLHFRLSATTYS